MNLQSFFLVSQSIEAILVSLLVIILIIVLIYLAIAGRRTKKKIIEVANENIETAKEIRSLVGHLGQSILDFLIVKILKNIKK
jgi:hypothetical protein